jgi:hypothetical protein
MQRDLIAATVREMLFSGGLFIQVSDLKEPPPRERSELTDPAPPYDAIRSLVVSFLGPIRRAGKGVLLNGTPSGEEAVLARNGFDGPQRVVVETDEVLRRGVDDVVAWVYSRSDSAPGLFASDLAAFDAELRALLTESSPSGRFAEHLPATEIFAWRRP